MLPVARWRRVTSLLVAHSQMCSPVMRSAVHTTNDLVTQESFGVIGQTSLAGGPAPEPSEEAEQLLEDEQTERLGALRLQAPQAPAQATCALPRAAATAVQVSKTSRYQRKQIPA